MPISTNLSTLDPAESQDVVTNDFMALTFEGLVGFGPTNAIEPRVAKSWTISPDGRVYTFHIRPNVTFSNGKSLTAADVQATWERNCAPGKGSPLPANYLGDIDGVTDRLASRAPSIRGVKVIDPLTLQVTLAQPRPYFLAKLAYPLAMILPSGTGPIRSTAQMIGSGPFIPQTFEPNGSTILTANPRYWQGSPALRKLTLTVVADPTTKINLFRTGRLDTCGLTQFEIPTIKKEFTVISSDRAAIFYIGMNGTVYPPFSDVRVRRAFVMAVDRDRVVRDVLGGIGTPAHGILPPTIPQTPRPKPWIPFDIAGARKLIEASGWKGKLPPLDLWVSDQNGDRRRAAELVVSMLRDALGVDARLRPAEANVVIAKGTKRELGFFFGSWYADYLDPENFLSGLLSAHGQDRTAWQDAEFTQLCDEADACPDPTRRAELYARAEDRVLTEAPWIPLYFPQEAVAIQPWVKGLESNAFGFMPSIHVTVTP